MGKALYLKNLQLVKFFYSQASKPGICYGKCMIHVYNLQYDDKAKFSTLEQTFG